MSELYRIRPGYKKLRPLSKTEEANLTFMLDYLQVFLERAMNESPPVSQEEAREYYHEDLVYYDPSSPDPIRGIPAIVGFLRQFADLYDEMHHTVLNFHLGKDYIALDWTGTAIVKTAIEGSAVAVGERIYANGSSRVRLKDGKIVEIHQIWTGGEKATKLNFRQRINEDVLRLLSSRQLDVYEWILEGKTNEEISVILGISPRTVEKHCEAIYSKLGVENRSAAIIRGLLEPES